MALNLPTLDDKLKINILNEYWEHSIIGLALVAEDGTILTANTVLCNMLGYNLDELQRKKYQDFTHPEDLVSDVTMAGRVASGEEEGYVMKKRFITKTGSVIWIMLRVRSIRNEDGSFRVFVSQVSDIIDVQEQLLNNGLDKIYVERKSKIKFRKIVKENWDKISFSLMIMGGLVYYIWEAATK